MKKFLKNVIEILIPIFNSVFSMFAIVGIYVFTGGNLKDEIRLMIIPIVCSMVYGAYIGMLAVKNVNK